MIHSLSHGYWALPLPWHVLRHATNGPQITGAFLLLIGMTIAIAWAFSRSR